RSCSTRAFTGRSSPSNPRREPRVGAPMTSVHSHVSSAPVSTSPQRPPRLEGGTMPGLPKNLVKGFDNPLRRTTTPPAAEMIVVSSQDTMDDDGGVVIPIAPPPADTTTELRNAAP